MVISDLLLNDVWCALEHPKNAQSTRFPKWSGQQGTPGIFRISSVFGLGQDIGFVEKC